MKKLEPFAVRTSHLTEQRLAELFLLADKAGAEIIEGNEELATICDDTEAPLSTVIDMNDYKFAGLDSDLETRFAYEVETLFNLDETQNFHLFASCEDACEYLNSIIESQIEESAAPEIDFTNTKLYTKDKELIKKYAKLCDAEIEKEAMHDKGIIGAFYQGGYCVHGFVHGSPVDLCIGNNKSVIRVTPEQVEAEYAKRFEGVSSETQEGCGIYYEKDGSDEVLIVGGDRVYSKANGSVKVDIADAENLSDLESLLERMRAL